MDEGRRRGWRSSASLTTRRPSCRLCTRGTSCDVADVRTRHRAGRTHRRHPASSRASPRSWTSARRRAAGAIPQFARTALEEWLPEAGIAYRWEKRLGGFRRPSPDNPDVVWREDMFRGYAEHMRSPIFLTAIDAVLAEAEAEPDTHHVTVMCSEGLWSRYLAAWSPSSQQTYHRMEVSRLMHDEHTRRPPAPTLALFRLRDNSLLVYDAGQDQADVSARPPSRCTKSATSSSRSICPFNRPDAHALLGVILPGLADLEGQAAGTKARPPPAAWMLAAAPVRPPRHRSARQ